jgi:hypothetical protein
MKNLLRVMFFVAIATMMGIGFESCGNSNQSKINVTNATILEDESELKEWFAFVPGTYGFYIEQVSDYEGDYSLVHCDLDNDIEFKKLKAADGYALKMENFYLLAKDNAGNYITDDIGDNIKFSIYNFDKLLSCPINNRVKLPVDYKAPNIDIAKKLLSTIAGFDIYCEVNQRYDAIYDMVVSDEWDKLLTDYENVLTEYLSLIKNVTSGAVDISKMTSIVEKLESLQEKLEKNSKSLNPKQAQKLNKLATKFANAAAQMD